MLANTLAVAEDAGLVPRLRTVFPDAAITALVGADGVHEYPLATVTFGDGEPAILPVGAATTGHVDRRPPLEFVIAAVDLGHLDDRGYRNAHLEAGLVDGRLHPAAFALGVGASGMTFLDPSIPLLLGEPLAGLLLTCIGVPAYRHRAGGPPGAPIKMRPLSARTPQPDACCG